jgi:cytochrome c6
MKKTITIAIALIALTATSLLAADSKSLYEDQCTKCHGSDGKGQTKMGQKVGAKDYTDPKVQDALKDAAAVKAIKEGLKGPEDKVIMKPTEGVSDDDIKGLVTYMRAFKK